MRRKGWKKRIFAMLMAFALCLGGLPYGQLAVTYAAELTPEDVSLSTYDLWSGNDAKWVSEPTDENWNLEPNEVYDYETNVAGVDKTALPATSTKGIKYGDKGSGSSFIYYEILPELPAGTYTLSTLLMGADTQIQLFIGDEKDSATYTTNGWNNWVEVNGTFTVSEKQQNVKVGYYLNADANGWGYIDQLYIKGETTVDDSDDSDTGYAIDITADADSVEVGGNITLNAKVTDAEGKEINDLEEAGLHLYWWDNTNDSASWFVDYDGTNGYALSLKVNPQKAGTYEIQAKLQDKDWKDLKIEKFQIKVEESSTAVEGDLNITKVKDLSDDFIMGMDISSVISEFESGVTYKDYEGKTIDNVTDFCKFLASNGITHIRVRVWNNPYDSNGNGYGGGNNDVAKAKQIADACSAAGIKMLVDFHCSDLWTDPGKQMVPKAWRNYTLDQKAEALEKFITDSLNEIDPDKDTVAMVQVGNETTTAFIGEKDKTDMCTLFNAGAAGVRAYNSDVKVVIHVTNPEKGNVTGWASTLDTNNVDYDIIATSYYPYWHGTLDNLKSEFKTVKDTYYKDVMVAETSYAYTLEDSDGHDNTVRVGNNDNGDNTTEPFNEQGQATAIRNLIAAVNEVGGLGVYYWEPAWLTVGDTRGLTGSEYDAQKEANKEKWEKYGSGWASSHAAEYDPDDAGKWFGGSAVDNEAMFYPDGTPTPGLHVWNYVKTGSTTTDVYLNYAGTEEELNKTVKIGEASDVSALLPKQILVSYSSEEVNESVSWNESDVAKIDLNKMGTYKVSGTVAFSKEITQGAFKGQTSAEVTCNLNVMAANLITDPDDAGLETATNFTTDNDGVELMYDKGDSRSGKCMHWYVADGGTASVTYNKVLELEKGSYVFEVSSQGAAGDKVTLQILDEQDNILFEGTSVELTGWNIWATPKAAFSLTEKKSVKLRIHLTIAAGGWGTADDLYLYQTQSSDSGSGDSGSSDSGSNIPVTPDIPSDGTIITENPDGTTTETKTETITNEEGKTVEVTTTTQKDKDGNVTGSTETSVIENIAGKASAEIVVEKNAAGEITSAKAEIDKKGANGKSGVTATLFGEAVSQITKTAGTEDVEITMTVTAGKKTYTVTAAAGDLSAGNKLQVVALDKKTGEYVLVNAKTYTVAASGNVKLTLASGKDYELVSTDRAAEIAKEILKTVKVKKTTTSVKKGKTTIVQMSSKLNMDNVKKITYTSSKKSVATVSKSGKVKAKKAGTTVIKAKVTLNNGKTKTVSMKVQVK